MERQFSRFSEFLQDKPFSSQRLPLVHTTDGFSFRMMMEHPIIKATPCSVYNNVDLAYFFYARPAYRPKTVRGSISLPAYSLVSMIIDSDAMPEPKRVMPFDSGAMSADLFSAFLHRDMKKEDFVIGQNFTSANQLVEYFFSSPINYYLGNAATGIQISASQFEAAHYYSLISHRAETKFDDRFKSIEFQYDVNIDLLERNVLAVVLPRDFMLDERFNNFVTNILNAEPLLYDTYHAELNEQARDIITLTKSFYEKIGAL